MMESHQTIGERLKYLRKINKLSQTQMAEGLGISQGTLSEIESGKSMPSLDVIVKISETNKLDLNWLVNNSLEKSMVLTEDEFIMVESYRRLKRIAKEEVLDYIELKLKRYNI